MLQLGSVNVVLLVVLTQIMYVCWFLRVWLGLSFSTVVGSVLLLDKDSHV